MRLYFDIEATNLLNSDSVDYNSSPYKLKDSFQIHCVVFIDIDSEEEYTFTKESLKDIKKFLLENCTELIGHNTICYDHVVLMAALGIDFSIGASEGEEWKYYNRGTDLLCGKPITITDTLVMSKTLNPDRPAHSIFYFGNILHLEKIDWRAKAISLGLIEDNSPAGAEFATYHPEMLEYCRRDCYVGIRVWKALLAEWGTWKWDDAYQLEKAVAEIIMHQEHRGFKFDVEKAKECVSYLDTQMESLKVIVEPLIPEKPLGITALKSYIPPKKQFMKNGSVSSNIVNWVEKHGGKVFEESCGNFYADVLGNKYKLPIPTEPIVTNIPATLKDITHIKGWLVGMGWEPSMYKEKDLTVDAKKHKLSEDKFKAACDRYIKQTIASPFRQDRMEHLECATTKDITSKLSKHDFAKRPLKVLTNPSLTVGTEKEICPNLLAMSGKFAHAQDVSNYLTFSHRRNSILGGNIDPDDDFSEMEKGWLSVSRIQEDGRIPTPADTCGAATSRFKHRLVANIPRVTSLYGLEMRSLFGVDNGYIQMGYDFSSLEAMIESHYCWKYDETKEYCNSLTQEKPNDVHTITAAKISDVLGRKFARSPAKSVKYCCAYGGQPKRVAKTVGCSLEDGRKIYEAYWDAAKPLSDLAEKLAKMWETTGNKKFIIGIDGRKIPTRSKSALVNSLFQSAGVICAKRAMVLHDRALKAEGLRVNFWLYDWKNLQFVQQLIAYHDEAQLEMDRSLVKWKLFKTKEGAISFKQDNAGWSEIGHSTKGYYVGWCKAGELIQKAVVDTSRYYNLNITLSADYILGRNWAECH